MANTSDVIAWSKAARDAATAAEIAYWRAKRLLTWWTAAGMAAKIPVGDVTLLEDGNQTHPLTLGELRALFAQLDSFVTDIEANSNQKLKVFARSGKLPGDWR